MAFENNDLFVLDSAVAICRPCAARAAREKYARREKPKDASVEIGPRVLESTRDDWERGPGRNGTT